MRSRIKIFVVFFFVILNGWSQNVQNPDEYVDGLIQIIDKSQSANYVKSLNYLKEAFSVENKLSDTTLQNLYRVAGIIYKNNNSYYISLNYFYKALELQEKINPSESFFIQNNIGGNYYALGDYQKARQFLEQALKGFEEHQKRHNDSSILVKASLIYNNLAILEAEEGNYVKALDILTKFKVQNENLKSPTNVILAHENISATHLQLNETDKALKELQDGLKLAEEIHSNYAIARLYSRIGNLYLENVYNKDSAIHYLKNSFGLSASYGFVDIQLYAAEKLVSFCENQKDYENALYYLHIAKDLSENIIKEENSKKISILEFEFEEKMHQNELLTTREKRERFLIFGIILLFFLSVIVLLMFQLQKSKSQKQIAENKLLAKQLEEKNKELTSNAITMLQTSEILNLTQKELSELDATPNGANDKMLSRIISDLQKGSMVFSTAEFEKLIKETDNDFYKKLLKEYPTLTKNEIRLCAFLKMNLSSKEIEAITKQSSHSIVVARSRLRKKLGLDEKQSLTSFLLRF